MRETHLYPEDERYRPAAGAVRLCVVMTSTTSGGAMNRNSRATLLVLILGGLAAGVGLGPETQARTQTAGVYVVGALHALHQTEESFDFDTLQRVVTAIKPEVMVLEVRPDELAERKDTPGRPEYPKVIWPLLSGSPAKAVAMEPGGQLFAQMTGDASIAMKAFTARDPEGSKQWSGYQRALETALRAHWQHPADAHDATTGSLSRAYYITQYATVGDAMRTVQEQWDRFMVDRALEAVRAAPDQRVLILCSYRNRHRFTDALGAEAASRLVEMESWLKANINSTGVLHDGS